MEKVNEEPAAAESSTEKKSPDYKPPNVCTDCTLLRCESGAAAATCYACTCDPNCCSRPTMFETICSTSSRNPRCDMSSCYEPKYPPSSYAPKGDLASLCEPHQPTPSTNAKYEQLLASLIGEKRPSSPLLKAKHSSSLLCNSRCPPTLSCPSSPGARALRRAYCFDPERPPLCSPTCIPSPGCSPRSKCLPEPSCQSPSRACCPQFAQPCTPEMLPKCPRPCNVVYYTAPSQPPCELGKPVCSPCYPPQCIPQYPPQYIQPCPPPCQPQCSPKCPPQYPLQCPQFCYPPQYCVIQCSPPYTPQYQLQCSQQSPTQCVPKCQPPCPVPRSPPCQPQCPSKCPPQCPTQCPPQCSPQCPPLCTPPCSSPCLPQCPEPCSLTPCISPPCCDPCQVDEQRPKCSQEYYSSEGTWEKFGVRIKWTDPVAPNCCMVWREYPVLYKLCVEVKPCSGLQPDMIEANCWTHMKTMCNPRGVWKHIPMLYQPDSSSEGEFGLHRYVYSISLTPTVDGTFKLSFNITWGDVLIWANNVPDSCE